MRQATVYQGPRTRQRFGKYYNPWIGAIMEHGHITERCTHKHYKREHAERCARWLLRHPV